MDAISEHATSRDVRAGHKDVRRFAVRHEE